jgi:hypothetical protein
MPKRGPDSPQNGALWTRGFDCLHSCQVSTAPHAEEFYEMFALPSSMKRPLRRLSGLPDWFERPLRNFRLSHRCRVPSQENRHLRPDASERQEASEADSFDGSNWPLRGVAALSPA